MAIKRAITSILLISMIIGVIFVDWLCGLVVTLFIIGGLYEFFCMLDKKGISAYKYFGIGLGMVIPLSIMFRFELTKGWEFLFIVLAMLFYLCLLWLLVWVLEWRKELLLLPRLCQQKK